MVITRGSGSPEIVRTRVIRAAGRPDRARVGEEVFIIAEIMARAFA
jgi:hypothetical protein